MIGLRARPWRIALPLFAVLVLAAAWVGYWYVSIQAAKREFARLDSHGVRLDCAREKWAGFPFRVTLICDRPDFRFGRDGVTVSGSGARLSATALIYRPTHVIAELASPSTITQTRAPDPAGRIPEEVTVASEAGVLRTGVEGTLSGVSRLTARLSGWSGTVTSRLRGRSFSETVRADTAAVHWEIPSGPAGTAPQNLAFEGDRLIAEGSGEVLDHVELALTVAHAVLPDGRFALEDPRAWQAAGGEATIRHLAIVQGARAAKGAGVVRLDAEGRLDGNLDLTVKDLDMVFGDLIASGRLTGDQAALAATALGLLARDAPAPEPGWSRVPVRLSRGRLYFGPFKAAQIAPLF